MKKFWKYVLGVIKALKGDYPYEQLEHLEFIKEKLKFDDEHLNASHHGIKVITSRHVSICGPAWRSAYLLPHAPLRKKLNRQPEVEIPSERKGWITFMPPELLFVDPDQASIYDK